MAANLSAFLAQNVKKVETIKYTASERFIDPEAQKPIEWEIGCITAAENSDIRKKCMTMIKAPSGIKGQYTQSFNSNEYLIKLCTRCTIFPDLNNKELQDSYRVMSAEELLANMLTPAEFDDYTTAVMKANGFKEDEELIEEAKN